MEENMMSPAELNSIAYMNKKRKFQAELLGVPFAKHVCWGQRLEYKSSCDSDTEPKKVRSNIFARVGESSLESGKDSYSFHDDVDFISPEDDANTYLSYSKGHASVDPSTSSASWDGACSEFGLHSLESRSITKSSSKSGSLSICEEIDCLHHDYGLYPYENYEDHLLEYQNDYIEHCKDKDLDDLLYSNGVAPSNYVLSSRRWSVNQDAQQGTTKLTIDKEFEQYFSMLML